MSASQTSDGEKQLLLSDLICSYTAAEPASSVSLRLSFPLSHSLSLYVTKMQSKHPLHFPITLVAAQGNSRKLSVPVLYIAKEIHTVCLTEGYSTLLKSFLS